MIIGGIFGKITSPDKGGELDSLGRELQRPMDIMVCSVSKKSIN